MEERERERDRDDRSPRRPFRFRPSGRAIPENPAPIRDGGTEYRSDSVPLRRQRLDLWRESRRRKKADADARAPTTPTPTPTPTPPPPHPSPLPPLRPHQKTTTTPGYAILLPQLPTITANYFASRRAGHPIDCSTYGPGHDSSSDAAANAATAANAVAATATPTQPPACVDGHADVVAWASVTSLLQNTVVGFLAAPLIGDLSDAHGRVPFAALGIALGLVPSGVVALHLRFPGSAAFPLWAYYPASVLSGAVSASTVFLAYASDVMPREHRVGAFAAIIAAFSLGFVAGPAVGATLAPADAAAATFAIASACALLTLFGVPESRSPEARRRGARRAAPRPADALLSLRRSAALLGSRGLFVRLALCMAIASIVSESVGDVLVQYLQLVAGFTTKDQGLLFVVIGACNLVVQGLLLPPLARRLGEVALLRGGLLLSAVEHAMLSVARTRGQALAAVAVGSFAGVAWPAVGAIKANNCGPDEQGLVQGALASLRALATGVGPLAFAALWRACATAEAPLGFRPGLVFWAAAALTLVAVGVAFTLPLQAGAGAAGAAGAAAAAAGAGAEAGGGGGGDDGQRTTTTTTPTTTTATTTSARGAKYQAVGTREDDDEEAGGGGGGGGDDDDDDDDDDTRAGRDGGADRTRGAGGRAIEPLLPASPSPSPPAPG